MNPSHILAIIVLYRCAPTHSDTCASMRSQIGHNRERISVMVIDHSPVPCSTGLPADWAYISDPTNPGLAVAYNRAAEEARRIGARWLLLLDQDSKLPTDFVASLQADAAKYECAMKIAAIVPIVSSNGRHVSPVHPMLGLDRPYLRPRSVHSGWCAAINSATLVRLSFVESIGGFNSEFWLDYLDHWLFRKIYDEGRSVFVTDSTVEHQLSVANFNKGLSIHRYRNILEAEASFANRYLPPYWRVILPLRLAGRGVKHIILTRDKRIASLMFSAACKQVAFLLQQVSRISLMRVFP